MGLKAPSTSYVHDASSGGFAPSTCPRHVAPLHPPPPAGEEFVPNPVRALQPPARRRLGRVPARADGERKAVAVGAGPDGDPRVGADLSAGPSVIGHPSRHRPRRPFGAVGDGGGFKVWRAVRRDRRTVGRPGEPRLHRDPAAGGRGGAVGSPRLAGAARRQRQFERRADALAGREPAEPGPSVRPARSRQSGVGRRAVPCPRASAGTVEHRP